MIVTKVYYPDFYGCIKGKTDLDFYQVIVFVGAIIGLLWANKRYKQGQENLKKTEESLEQSEEIAFKNKMNTQYLEVIKAISDENQKKTPIVVNLINAIQVSIAIFYDTEEKEMKARKETLNFREMNLTGVLLTEANLTEADLKGVHLTEADLTEADLRGADLIYVNLTKANLIKANLMEADLKGANLTKANLTEANLRKADLRGADLTKANLTKANLRWADLRGVDLTEADLTGANLAWAVFTINFLNTLSRNQLNKAKNVTKIKIYIDFEDKFYSLKEFVEMNPPNSITDEGCSLEGEIFDYFVKLSKKN